MTLIINRSRTILTWQRSVIYKCNLITCYLFSDLIHKCT